MLVIAAILAHYLGQIATVGALLACTLMAAIARHPVAVVPLAIAGLWIAGTVDFVDYFDGPMRIDAEANLLGTGRAPPSALSGPSGPVWWIPTLAAVTLATLTQWPKLPNLRAAALAGLACLALTYAGYGALTAMY